MFLFLHSDESRKMNSFLQLLSLSYAACVFLHTACARECFVCNVSDPAAFFLNFFFNMSAMQVLTEVWRMFDLLGPLSRYKFTGIHRKIQLKYQPSGRPFATSSEGLYPVCAQISGSGPRVFHSFIEPFLISIF